MRETQVQSLGWEDLLEKEMATHSSILAWRIPWREEPGRLQSTRSQSQTRLSYIKKKNVVEVMKIMVTSFKRSHACTATFSTPNPAVGHHDPRLCWRLLETPGNSQASLGQSPVGVTAPFSWVLVHTRFCLCPPRVCFQSCKFWQLYGRVNGDLLQEGLCHTQVCSTQTPCPCSNPLQTRTSTGYTQIVLSQSLWGLWVPMCTQFVWAL